MYRAPGRVNIVGEHTDYNDGFVMPFAIDKYVNLKVSYSDKFLFVSKDFNTIITLKQLKKTGTWADYIIGSILDLQNIVNAEIPPLKFEVASTLPIGAGLSSSAALEVVAIYAINDIFELGLRDKKIAEIAWSVENNFIGLNCGIMDQYACTLSKKNHALFIDTYTKEYELLPLNLRDYEFYIIDSGVKHELGNSQYNLRRQQCNDALKEVNKNSFRDFSYDDLNKLNGVLYKRAKHVLDENSRVLKVREALKINDVKTLGYYLWESHNSLKELYEVSCEEIDFIIDLLQSKGKVLGARIIGGGFGGSVLVLAKNGELENYMQDIKGRYKNKYGIDLNYFKAKSSNGVEKL